MTATEALDILNNKSKVEDPLIKDMLKRWSGIYYSTSLHTLGAEPCYKSLRTGQIIYPTGYLGKAYDEIFDERVFARHPREDEDTRNWRKSVYRPITRTSLGLLSDVVIGAIFQDNNYDIHIDSENDNEYIWGANFSGVDLVSYFSSSGYQHIIDDANGFFAVVPAKDRAKTRAEKECKPIIIQVKTSNILYIDEHRTSIVFKDINERYAWLIDENVIYRYVKEDKSKKYTLEDTNGYYAHMMGRLPLVQCGGDWNTHGWYESYYSKAIPYCYELCSTFSAAQMVDKEASHPYIIEPNVDCPAPDCRDGYVTCEDESQPDGVRITKCSICHGTGAISRYPGQRVVMPKEDIKDGVTLTFVNPDTSINELHRKNVDVIQLNIMEALSLVKVEEAQSGVAKAIDQERLYKFISKISNRIFDVILYELLIFITAYRNVSPGANGNTMPKPGKFTISKPKQFKIQTSADLMEEYQNAIKAEMPIFARRQMLKAWAYKEYSGDEATKKLFDYILFSDPLSVATLNEAKSMAATPEQIDYHKMLPIWLDTVLLNKGAEWFIAAKFEAITKEVDKLKPKEQNNNQ